MTRLGTICALLDEAARLRDNGLELRAAADRVIGRGGDMNRLYAELEGALEIGTLTLDDAAAKAQAMLDEAAGDEADGPIPFMPWPPKPVRKTRADAGKARGPRAKSNEGRMQAGELPEDAVRAAPSKAAEPTKAPSAQPDPPMHPGLLGTVLADYVEKTLTGGPLSMAAILAYSWAASYPGSLVRDYLCEAPGYISWTGAKGLEVWGTRDQFDLAVGKLAIPGIHIEARPKFTANALGCSVSAALEAWKRLDPRQT